MAQFSFTRRLPGLLASLAVALAALAIEQLQVRMFGRPLLDAVVVAIVLGTLVNTLLGPDERLDAGIAFAAKPLLELAIVLLGASTSAAILLELGLPLLVMVAVIVVLALAASYVIARGLGLSHRVAALIACGNSICGNSAIATVAPAIGARADEVASAIAFTAALGVLVVIVLPVLAAGSGLDQVPYGILAGMTVYAVPQVLAATVPVGVVSVQVGTLIKLARVLMLGPVTLVLGAVAGQRTGTRPRLSQLVPWFIVAFLVAMGINSLGLIPAALQPGLHQASTGLTILAMAALGLSVDIRTVLASGGRVLAAGALSILVLGGISLVGIALVAPLS